MRLQGGIALMEDSGDHRLSRDCTIMGPAGLTAVFGMGTGVTPPVWSPEKPPAGCHATPAAIPLDFRWSITHSSSGGSQRHPLSKASRARSHLTSDQNLNQNPESMSKAFGLMPDLKGHISVAICHLPLVLCHRRFGSVSPPWIGCLRLHIKSGGEPIGVVKLLGC